MKRTIACILALLNIFIAFSQSFEGKVIYKNSFKSKSTGVSDGQLDTMMGTIQEYYIKGGNYKTVINGTFFQAQLYHHNENKFFSKTSNIDTFQSLDASINSDELIKTELNKSEMTVLGYQCDELILTCKSGIQKYYFNSKLPLDPEQFKGHQYGNWYVYLKLSHALPLKMVVENQQFHLESEAIEILPMVLQEDAFLLAPDGKTFKITSREQPWILFENTVFKINFPKKPTEDIQSVKTEIGELKVKNYTYETSPVEPDPNMMYSVADTDYPDSLIHSDKKEVLDKFFDGSINGIVDNVQGKLISQVQIQKDGFPGREIKIDFHNGLAIFNVRMFLIKNKMLLLQTITYSKNDPNTSIARFMDSLVLNK